MAQSEAKEYSKKQGFEALDFLQAYWLPKDSGPIPQGCEIFSLLRESDLEPEEYLDRFFDTGEERQTDYWDEE
ncbi:hypothetical protein AAFN60_04080 [Roseibacillus persicicus]|nr:hypothetical protein [Roseibacillus persicicus]